jgi:hypothetical protein
MTHPSEWNSLVKAAVYAPVLDGKPVSWFSTVQQYLQGTGLRIYLPGSVLCPVSDRKIETMGDLCKASYGSGDVYYISIPLIDGDIILGRRKLE